MRTSQYAKSPSSLATLVEAQQRLEMARRVRDLRERSPFTQPRIAEELGIGLRAYQKLEAEGTTKWERVEELATIHWGWAKDDPEYGYVSAGWIWDGKDRRKTPDLMRSLDGAGQLDRIEESLERVEARQVEALAHVAELLQHQQEKPSHQKRPEGGEEAAGT